MLAIGASGDTTLPGTLRGPDTLRGSGPSDDGASDDGPSGDGAPVGGVLGTGAPGALRCALVRCCGGAPPGRWIVAGEAAPGAGVVEITDEGTGVLRTESGVTPCACGCASFTPVWILKVGAIPFSPAARRAPHPPQNRESGSFWVPQVVQRIPPQG
jgi:hypothetical protein